MAVLAAEHLMVRIQDTNYVRFASLGLPLAPSVRVPCQFWRQHDAARGFDFQMALGCLVVREDPEFVHSALDGPESLGIRIHGGWPPDYFGRMLIFRTDGRNRPGLHV